MDLSTPAEMPQLPPESPEDPLEDGPLGDAKLAVPAQEQEEPLVLPEEIAREELPQKTDRPKFFELKFNRLDRDLTPEERHEWNSIYASYRGHSAITGTIIGIEPGAGLTRATQEDVMPGYGLDDYELTTSSTTAMLAELDTAIQNENDIVVTLWTPFWANNSFPVKALEDPEGLFPEPESLHILASEGFSEDYPDIAEFAGDVKISDEKYSELEDMVVNEYGEGREAEAIQAWLDENPDLLPALPETAGE